MIKTTEKTLKIMNDIKYAAGKRWQNGEFNER